MDVGVVDVAWFLHRHEQFCQMLSEEPYRSLLLEPHLQHLQAIHMCHPPEAPPVQEEVCRRSLSPLESIAIEQEVGDMVVCARALAATLNDLNFAYESLFAVEMGDVSDVLLRGCAPTADVPADEEEGMNFKKTLRRWAVAALVSDIGYVPLTAERMFLAMNLDRAHIDREVASKIVLAFSHLFLEGILEGSFRSVNLEKGRKRSKKQKS